MWRIISLVVSSLPQFGIYYGYWNTTYMLTITSRRAFELSDEIAESHHNIVDSRPPTLRSAASVTHADPTAGMGSSKATTVAGKPDCSDSTEGYCYQEW